MVEPAVLVSQNFITHQMYIYVAHIYDVLLYVHTAVYQPRLADMSSYARYDTYFLCNHSTASYSAGCLLDLHNLQGCTQPRAAASYDCMPILQTRPERKKN